MTKRIIKNVLLGLALVAIFEFALNPGFYLANAGYFLKNRFLAVRILAAAIEHQQTESYRWPGSADSGANTSDSSAFASSATLIKDAAKDAPDTLRIPSLGIVAPVRYVSDNSDKTVQTALQAGTVHYPNTPEPGGAGNVYIFGHSSDYFWSPGKFKNVFALLPQIKNGAQIFLSGHDGSDYAYAVVAQHAVRSNDLSVLAQDPAKHQLTLQTSYPIGTAYERYVVIAELQK